MLERSNKKQNEAKVMWRNRLKLFSYTVDEKGSLFRTVSAQKVHFHPHRPSQKRSLLLAAVWWRQCDGEGLQGVQSHKY